ARPKRGLEQAREEIIGFDRELPLRPDDFDFAIERDDARRQFGGRIGEGERAADGAAVADRGVADMWQRQSDQRRRPRDLGGARPPASPHPPTAPVARWAFPTAPRPPPPMPLMSTSSAGSLSRMLSVAIRLCPPASSRASSLASNSIACATERALA